MLGELRIDLSRISKDRASRALYERDHICVDRHHTLKRSPPAAADSVVWVRTEQLFQRLFGPLLYDIIKP